MTVMFGAKPQWMLSSTITTNWHHSLPSFWATVWWSRNKQKWGQLRLSAEWLNLNPHRNSFTGPSAACSSNERLCNFAHVVLILSLCRLQNDSCQVQVDSHCVGRNSVANPSLEEIEKSIYAGFPDLKVVEPFEQNM